MLATAVGWQSRSFEAQSLPSTLAHACSSPMANAGTPKDCDLDFEVKNTRKSRHN